MPVIIARGGPLHLGRQGQALPRRPRRAVRRAGRARPHRAGRGRRQAGQRAGVLPAVVLRAPQGGRAGRAAGRPRARRPQPGLLHHRRRRGGRERLEGGQAVLQADRQADEAQGDQPQHRLPRHPARARCRITGIPAAKAMFEPLVPGAHKVPNTNFYRAPEHGDDLEAFGRWAADRIEEAIEFEGPETVAAVFLEPVQNSGGCFPPPPGYFQRVREICDKYDVLLVSDEVICAFGRLGHYFGCDAVRLPARHHHLRQGHDLGLLPDRRDDRHRPDHGAVPAGQQHRSPTATPSAATRSRRRWRWPTSTSSSARGSTSTCCENAGGLPAHPGEADRPADRRRRARRRLLLRHRAGQGQGDPRDVRRRRVASGCCAASCPRRCSTPASTAAPTTAATRSSSSRRR